MNYSMKTLRIAELSGRKLLHNPEIIIISLLLLALTACGGGGGGSTNNDAWESGIYKSADSYDDKCEFPRTSIQYSDVQGTVLDENNWLRSWSNEIYLWYDEILDRDPGLYTSTSDYFPLLKTSALTLSGQPKDRFHFTYDTEVWKQLSQSGVTAGYGAALAIIQATPPRKILVAYTEPNSPATTTDSNLVRGTEIVEVDGVDVINAASQTNVDIINAGLFPDTTGEVHTFGILDPGETVAREITMTSAQIVSQPVKNVSTIDTPSGKVGYMVFNDHIATAEQQLINAVNQLNTENIVDLVVDLRYNGGGFLYIASELAYMIAGNMASSGQTFELMRFNDKHPNFNPFTNQLITPTPFYSQSLTGQALPSLNLSRVFVITGPGTCSASEAIINGLRGIDLEVIQIGSSTCGKPYGFYPVDNCSTTYFTINFAGENAKGFGDYTDGFSPVNTTTTPGVLLDGCAVADDYTRLLGDPAENRLAAALAYRATGSCPAPTSISRTGFKSSLSAVDGFIQKPAWLENRIMGRPE